MPYDDTMIVGYIRQVHQTPLQQRSLMMSLRSDLASKTQLCRLTLRVGGIARVGEAGQSARLGQQRVELGPVGKPLLDVFAIERALDELLVIRTDLVPGGLAERVG